MTSFMKPRNDGVAVVPARPTTHTHTCLAALCPGLPGWASTRKVKPIWILLKQETVSGSGISWAICKSAPRSRQIPRQHPTAQFFHGPDALSAAQPTVSKHWRHWYQLDHFPLNSRQTIITASSLLNFYKLHTFRDTQQTQLKQCREKWHIPLTLSFTLPLEFVALSTIIIIITTNIMSCNVT